METREVHKIEARIYVLILNTFGAAESGAVGAWSDNYQKLVEFYQSQLLPPNERFRDEGGFYHSFAHGPSTISIRAERLN